jgi:transposase
MRRLQVTDAERVKSLLKSETEHSPRSTFLHRLHCVALVAAGLGCDDVATAFGDDRRSVQRWVSRFQQSGVEGLTDSLRAGRPAKLGEPQLQELRLVLAEHPRACGYAADAWNAETLRLEIRRRFSVDHSRRHCVRLLGQLGQADVRDEFAIEPGASVP